MTTHAPRDYQSQVEQAVYARWAEGFRNVLLVLPTGAGKTFVFARIAAAARVAVCAIAHRSELVGQMSVALAREGVRHRVVGPDQLQRACSLLHMEEFGRSFIDPGAKVAVASVDTLVGMSPTDPWVLQVGLWIQDEAHHVLADNKWGRACALFPNAQGLGVTATPIRADGKGLGRLTHTIGDDGKLVASPGDGLMDAMVVGPTMRELIDRGYLTEYRIFAPPSNLDLSDVGTTDSGEFSPKPLKVAVGRSSICGDVVEHYLRIAPGKLGVTFAVDIEEATKIAAKFRTKGVPAEVVSSKTPGALRRQILRRFKTREILQLVNVDLFGEGFDLPAIEVVSFARPTQSFALFCQQFGRSLRLMEGKLRAIIIDHVGNVERHRLPDAPRVWSMDRRTRSVRSAPTDVVPVRTCTNPDTGGGVPCMSVYERVLLCCPYCKHKPEIAVRSTPAQVDGDCFELSPEVLAAMRGEIAKVDGDVFYPNGTATEVMGAIRKRHYVRQQAQAELRSAISLWAGWQLSLGRPDAESHRRFFHRFGLDVLSAQALGPTDAATLTTRIASDLQRNNIIELGISA